MDIKNEEVIIKENGIQYGDLFIDTDDDNYFLFVERPNIALVGLNGTDFYESFKGLDEALKDIRDYIDNGELKHLSQDKWQFQLKRK